MIDLHTHILPEFDDGAYSFKESVRMAKLACEDGTNILVATPHCNQKGRYENYYNSNLVDSYNTLTNELKKQKIPVEVYLGMEIFASKHVVNKIEREELIGINHSSYYLIEFELNEDKNFMNDILMQMIQLGKIPLIAHPERYQIIQENPDVIYPWLEAGCLTQINGASLFGKFGSQAQWVSRAFLKNNCVTCVASAAHDSLGRSPCLSMAYNWISWRYGSHHANVLMNDNPLKIIKNETI